MEFVIFTVAMIILMGLIGHTQLPAEGSGERFGG
jgi:hypothetical protein